MKRAYIIYSLIIGFLLLNVQVKSQKITVSGYVKDMFTGEKLLNATVYEISSLKATVSNNFGFYSFSFSSTDSLYLRASYIGYENKDIFLKLNRDTIINIFLKQETYSVDEVVIVADANSIQNRNEMSSVTIPISQIKTLPSLSGESDLMRAFQLMPGIQQGNEGTSSLYVRGGSPDQNLILLDDVPLYYVNHIGGFISVFEPNSINSMKILKGGFPARYSGRLSSIIDIRMKDGNMKETKGAIGLGLLSSKIFIETPIIKEKSSVIFSVRRCNLDAYSYLANNVFSFTNDNAGYTFYDVNAKINYKLSRKDNLYFSIYSGDDNVFYNSKYEDNQIKTNSSSKILWGNKLSSFRWNHIYGSRSFGNLTLSFTHFKFSTKLSSVTDNLITEGTDFHQKYIFYSGVRDAILKYDFEHYLSNHKIKYGFGFVYHYFTPGNTSYIGIDKLNNQSQNLKLNALEPNFYIEDQFKLFQKLNINIGLNASSYILKNKTFNFFEPRLLFNYLMTEKFSLKTSYSRMHQYVHLLTNSNGSLPTDLWVPSNDIVPPEQSDQYCFGIDGTVNRNYEFSMEAYYKKLSNLISYQEGVLMFSDKLSWDDKIIGEGAGEMYGLEALLQKRRGNFTGWVSYTISKNERVFKEINQGIPYPYKYHRAHDFSIVCNYRLKENINLSCNWIFATGANITLPNNKYKLINKDYFGTNNNGEIEYAEAHIYNGKNGFRLPNIHRLDVGVNFKKKKPKGERIWSISIYNIYNRKNPYLVYFKEENGKTKLYQYSLFPIMPSFNYSFSF